MDNRLSKLEREQRSAEAERFAMVGITTYKEFEHTGTLSDLEKAIGCFQRALSLAPEGHAEKPQYLNNLGISFANRFGRTGMLDDLDEAIQNTQQAVSLTSDDHARKPIYLINLGNSFLDRFGRTGMLSDIKEAIQNQQHAILLTPDYHAHKPIYLTNLGTSFHRQFWRTGMLSDIEEAIKHQQQAVSLIPDNHPSKPACLTNLGTSFQGRFSHTGNLSDIGEAIKHQQRAVSLIPNDHVGKSVYFSNLGTSFDARFRRTGVPSDLMEAIRNDRQAVLLTPENHPGKPAYLSKLGLSCQSQFARAGVLSDLEEAIGHQQQAVSLTPDGHADKPRWLNYLGLSFQSRFGHTGVLSDVEEAIKYHQQAASLTPDDHANKPWCLSYIGNSFKSRYHRTGMQDDLEEAISNFQSAATSNISSISLRCHAFRRWACLEATRNPPAAVSPYRQAINLLPRVAWIGDSIATRHLQLTGLDDVPREAAAFALDVGRPDLALEWLEQGRSVVWSQFLHLRTSVNHLGQAHPDLCAEFTKISHELQNAATRGHMPEDVDVGNPILFEEETQRHHRLAEKWELLVEKIRSHPDFHDFLLPKKVSVLMEAAASGPVVVINIHQRRCDALIVKRGTDHVLHIPLDKLRYEDVVKMSEIFKEDLIDHRYRGNPTRGGSARLAGILSKLFLHVVAPVLKGLGLMTDDKPDPSSLPRVWWCPTGPLTFLPLHAACRTVGARTEGTFTHVISSYTPTVNALLEARAAKLQPFNRIVGVAMTHTPSFPWLPDVETEIAHIGKLFSDDTEHRCDILRDEQATGERVLAHMANSSWIHLACHAIQDEQAPTQSGFCLHDRRLMITDIIAKQFAHADFAFLSACETATGAEKASDEAVHIAAAMLGAGYRNVIGTMWAIPDEVAPRIAAKVYEVLLSGGEPDSNRAAQALHEAVREERELNPDSFNFWVPFVHYGV